MTHGPNRLRHSLRTRLLLWTVGVTSLILAAVIGWNYLNVLERLSREAQRRATFVAEASADKIDAELAILQGVAQGIALTLEAQSMRLGLQDIRALQEAALRQHPQIRGLAIAMLPEEAPPDWRQAAPYARRARQGFGYLDLAADGRGYIGKDWFSLPRYLERAAWSEPYLKNSDGLDSDDIKMVAYSVPIRLARADGLRFAGVVAIEIDLGWLDQAIAKLPVGRQGYGLLMTRNGTYISHPVQEVDLNESVFSIAEARGDPALRRVGQRMISGEPGLTTWVSWAAGEPSWLAWHPLETADWTMGTVVSQNELRQQIRRFSQEEALVGLIGLGLLVLAVWFLARSITRPVLALGAATATLARGDLDADLPVPRGRDEVARLTADFAAMRDSLRRHIADLALTTAARERMNGELRIAREIQMDLVPKTFPAFPERNDMDLFAIMEPAREVGGDFYDFFPLDHERLAIAIGDVSGKGVPAALFMAVTRSFLRSAFRVDEDPGTALTRVNDELAASNDSCMFVTLFCAVVRLSDGRVEYANAGHNPPLLIDPEGGAEWIGEPFGPAAGAWPGSRYTTGSFRLEPEAMLLLYTDGVTEAMDPANQLFGEPRLAERIQASRGLACKDCLDSLLAAIGAHAAGAEQSDDITMLMIKRTQGDAQDQTAATGPELQLDIANRLEDLSGALERLGEFLRVSQATPGLAYAAQLVLEELVTNVIKYGYEDSAEHRIRACFALGPPASLRIEDDGRPFDPTARGPAVDLEAEIEDRPIGGLGLHMVRSSVASLDYRRVDDCNRIEIRFPD